MTVAGLPEARRALVTPPRARLDGLDALRGIAALWVLLFHLGDHFPLLGFARRGYLAVDFFFLLSGYVMTRTYEARLAGGTLTPLSFLWLRVRRLMPVMIFAGFLGALFADPEMSLDMRITLFLLSALCVPVLDGGNMFPVNGPQWSILFEFIANWAHSVGLARWRDRGIALLVGVSFLGVLAALLRFDALDVGGERATVAFGLPRLFYSYGLGILLARRWGDAPPLAVPPLATLLLLPLWLWLTARAGPLAPLGELLFVTLGTPLLLAGGIRLKAGRVGRWLGQLSFPVYAVHAPLITALAGTGDQPLAGLSLVTLVIAAALWLQNLPHRARGAGKSRATDA